MAVPDRAALDRLVEQIVAVRPVATVRDRRFALSVYRLLAGGDPVDAAAIGHLIDESASTVRDIIGSWPTLIELDTQGLVTGFGGLTVNRTRHRLEIAGRTLYTWCAWDSIFIPGILGTPARLDSTSPDGDRVITVMVDESGTPHDHDPDVVMTMPDTACCNLEENVRGNFCDAVNLFPSRASANTWTGERSDLFVLTLEQAAEMGRRKNAAQFGKLIARHG